MAPEKVERLKKIAETTWMRTLDDTLGLSWEEGHPQAQVKFRNCPWPRNPAGRQGRACHRLHDKQPIAADNPWGFTIKAPAQKFNLGEVYNLSMARGTLTNEDRYHINDHIVQTIIMLEALPFPKNLKRVPEWAGGHHEKMDGTGYPKSLKNEQMSMPGADHGHRRYLRGADRPRPPLQEGQETVGGVKIMSFMKKDQHIDAELFELFLTSGVYKEYAENLPAARTDRRGRHLAILQQGGGVACR